MVFVIGRNLHFLLEKNPAAKVSLFVSPAFFKVLPPLGAIVWKVFGDELRFCVGVLLRAWLSVGE